MWLSGPEEEAWGSVFNGFGSQLYKIKCHEDEW